MQFTVAALWTVVGVLLLALLASHLTARVRFFHRYAYCICLSSRLCICVWGEPCAQ